MTGDQRDLYDDLLPNLRRLDDEAKFIIESCLAGQEIKIHSLTSRIKTKNSTIEKIKRLEVNSIHEIVDLVGVRIVCLFLSDIYRIVEMVRENFFISSEDDKISSEKREVFGYSSFHVVCKMPESASGARYNIIKLMPFEIQIRTIAMDAWAAISHHLDYKSENSIPLELRRDFYALSGLMYVADAHFKMLYDLSKKSHSKERELINTKVDYLDNSINLDTLSAYLEKRYPHREMADPLNLSETIEDLQSVDIFTLRQLDEVLDKTKYALRQLESDENRTGFYNTVGVIRISLDFINQKWQEIRESRGSPVVAETNSKYKKLIDKSEPE